MAEWVSILESMNNQMKKPFQQVNGALKRNNKTELECKKIWLERVCQDLPDTIWHGLALEGLCQVNKKLSGVSGGFSD